MSSTVNILIPTCNRPYSLAMTLTSLATQTMQDMRIHISGCGMIPWGAYHMELPTTVRERPIDAPHVLWQRVQPQHKAWTRHA